MVAAISFKDCRQKGLPVLLPVASVFFLNTLGNRCPTIFWNRHYGRKYCGVGPRGLSELGAQRYLDEKTSFLSTPCGVGRSPCSGLGYHTDLPWSVVFVVSGVSVSYLCRVGLYLVSRWGSDNGRVVLRSSCRFNCNFRPEPLFIEDPEVLQGGVRLKMFSYLF